MSLPFAVRERPQMAPEVFTGLSPQVPHFLLRGAQRSGDLRGGDVIQVEGNHRTAILVQAAQKRYQVPRLPSQLGVPRARGGRVDLDAE